MMDAMVLCVSCERFVSLELFDRNHSRCRQCVAGWSLPVNEPSETIALRHWGEYDLGGES